MAISNNFRGRPPWRRPRSDAIDFWRGLVLCTIFVNHMPGNLFEALTHRNLGFSDSAEAFVFLSGLSMALAYGPRFMNGGAPAVTGKIARRVVRIYGVHVGLSLAAIAIFGIGAILSSDSDLLDVHGRDLFVDDPEAALVGIVSLGHQLGYFNILPLYILLVAAVPGLLWLARVDGRLMLAASALLYVCSRLFGWTFPTWPMQGEWFFDPFAWQLLLTIGLAVGLRPAGTPVPVSRAATGLAALLVAAGAVAVTNAAGFWPGLYDTVRQWADLDKAVLGSGRLLHFLALAYLIHALGVTDRLRRLPLFRPLCLLGCHSLAMFTLLSLLAAAGQVVMSMLDGTVWRDAILVGGGLALLYATARLLDARASAVAAHGGLRVLRF